jgi:16S rRNA processing protein RimM
MEDMLRVGVVTSTHGIRGEVKVFPTTDDPERFEELEYVIVDEGRTKTELKLGGVKYFKQFVILKFKGIDDINDVMKYVKKDLWIYRKDAVACGENENFICDLIGLKVRTDEGEELGILDDVIQTAANDVYQVKINEEKKVLIPAIRQCILNVNLEEHTMTVHLLDGLLDL